MALCANCGIREGTGKWIGHACTLCAMRFGLDRLPEWCALCMTEAQTEHARKFAAQLPALEQMLAELKASATGEA